MVSLLADFAAHTAVEAAEWDGPVEGRVLLNETELVLAKSGDEKATVRLDSIFDIRYDSAPKFVDPMPGTPMTVGYRDREGRTTAVVWAPETQTRKFRAVLFKALLNGTHSTVKHPAKLGGRVLDTSFEGALLSLDSSSVELSMEDGRTSIPLDAVVDFSRETRAVEGSERQVLVISHVDAGEAMTTVVATESGRKLNLLGRYVRRIYQSVIDHLRQLELSEPETEMLTTLYSVGDADVSLPSVLGLDPTDVKRLLHALHEKGLVESGDHGPVLTAKGQIVVNEYLERVNA